MKAEESFTKFPKRPLFSVDETEILGYNEPIVYKK